MAINYTFEVENDVLIVQSSGYDEGLENVIAFNKAVNEKAFRTGCRKIISDERELKYTLSVFETYSLGEFVSTNIREIDKIALVVKENQEEIALFWENVTANRRINTRVFLTMEEAKNWIRR